METPSSKPRPLTLHERATSPAGPCRACSQLKLADGNGWEFCPRCDTNPLARPRR